MEIGIMKNGNIKYGGMEIGIMKNGNIKYGNWNYEEWKHKIWRL